jgi:DNA replication protein DnaC
MTSVEEVLRATLARVQVDDQANARAAEQSRYNRAAEAQRVLDRLPACLRTPTRAELERRVRDTRLLQVTSWTWEDGNVLLLGATQIGKSTCAAILFRSLLANGVVNGGRGWDLAQTMQWFDADRLANARREQQYGRGEASDITSACNARLLFLDDAGWDENPRAVSEVLKTRFQRGWPAIITSGKTTQQLLGFYGDAVSERMLGAGRRPLIIDCFQEATR